MRISTPPPVSPRRLRLGPAIQQRPQARPDAPGPGAGCGGIVACGALHGKAGARMRCAQIEPSGPAAPHAGPLLPRGGGIGLGTVIDDVEWGMHRIISFHPWVEFLGMENPCPVGTAATSHPSGGAVGVTGGGKWSLAVSALERRGARVMADQRAAGSAPPCAPRGPKGGAARGGRSASHGTTAGGDRRIGHVNTGCHEAGPEGGGRKAEAGANRPSATDGGTASSR